MIIDATDLIVGRMGTVIAKKALLGEKIDIINCEKAIITGKRESVLGRFKQKKEFGTYKGPFLHRQPDRIVRRMIRGMLPYKKERGRNAFERIMCYVGVPEQLKNEKAETIETANVSKLDNLNFITVKEVSKFLGAKI